VTEFSLIYGLEGVKKEKVPKDWFKSYDNAEFEVICRNNYLDFIL